MVNNVYWKPDRVVSYNAYMNFLVGQRGVGKTYALTKKMINDFIKHGKMFAYVRRREVELDKINKFFDDMIFNNEFPNVEFEVRLDTYGAEFYINEKLAGHAIPLSHQRYYKSYAYPELYNIMFDEFIISTGGSAQYLKKEVTEFAELQQSLLRKRWGNIYFIGNALSISNPYFAFHKIDMSWKESIKVIGRFTKEYVEQFTREDFESDEEMNMFMSFVGRPLMLVERVYSKGHEKEMLKSPFGALYAGTAYGDYAMSNKFLLDDTQFVKKKSNKSSCQYAIRFDGSTYGLWYDYNDKDIYVVDNVFDPNVQTAVIISNDHDPTTLYVGRSHHRIKEMKDAYHNSRLWFNNEQCYGKFKEVLRLVGL